jgi:hypothetical protein
METRNKLQSAKYAKEYKLKKKVAVGLPMSKLRYNNPDAEVMPMLSLQNSITRTKQSA